jgi:hypothetical protein
MLTLSRPSLAQVIEGLLEGFAAAVVAVTLAVFVLWTALLALFLERGAHPFAVVPAAFGATLAMWATGFIVALNLPFAVLFSYRFNGPLAAAVAFGTVSGAVEGYLLAQLGHRPEPAAELLFSVLGGLGGAMLAWRVWANCVAPRRVARSRGGPKDSLS